jgi:hypothetical protein
VVSAIRGNATSQQNSPHKRNLRALRLNAPETCRRRSEPPWLRKSARAARIFGRLAWPKRPRPVERAEAYAASETARRCHPPMYWGLLVLAPRPRLPSRYNRQRRPRELPPLSTRPTATTPTTEAILRIICPSNREILVCRLLSIIHLAINAFLILQDGNKSFVPNWLGPPLLVIKLERAR